MGGHSCVEHLLVAWGTPVSGSLTQSPPSAQWVAHYPPLHLLVSGKRGPLRVMHDWSLCINVPLTLQWLASCCTPWYRWTD